MSERNILIALVISTFALIVGQVSYDLQEKYHVAQGPVSNWKWADTWNGVPTTPISTPPVSEKPVETPKEQIVCQTYAEAIAKSGETGLPVLVYVYADWCGACKTFKANTLPNGQVKEAMKRYIFVAVDGDRNRDVIRKQQIGALPTCVITNGTEKPLKAMVGSADPTNFTAWLTDPSMYVQPKK